MAIEIMEIHHTGVRIDTGAEKLEATKEFYNDVLGLPHDTKRPTIQAFRARGSMSARWARSI